MERLEWKMTHTSILLWVDKLSEEQTMEQNPLGRIN